MRYLIGIDDTDNEYTRGTGFRTRDLTNFIQANKMGNVFSISRHQLYVHPEIPYTSHNSSACIDLETKDIEKIKSFCIEYLLKESAEDSDVGLCIAEYNSIGEKVINWACRAKTEILSMDEAIQIANIENIYLEGFLGTKCGIIGALAAVGLRKHGNDGRLIWITGEELRNLNGIYTVSELFELCKFDKIKAICGSKVELKHRILVNEWIRPIINNNQICIIVESNINQAEYEWKIASKEYIKSISD